LDLDRMHLEVQHTIIKSELLAYKSKMKLLWVSSENIDQKENFVNKMLKIISESDLSISFRDYITCVI